MVATPSAPGAILLTTLTGNELVDVIGAGPQSMAVKVRAIADLNGAGLTTDIVNTPITTAGNGTLTAAALLGGLITRTGPVADFTDTPATAAQIVTAIGTFVSGATFNIGIKNSTAFIQTLTTSAGVTWPTTAIVGPFEFGSYYGVLGGTAASPTVAFTHLDTTPIGTINSLVVPQAVALNTVGAATVLASAINPGATLRGGSQSGTPFSDTTDTAAAIIAGNVGLVGKIGAAFLYRYVNTTNALATLGGGTGVTVSQITAIPAGMTALYLVTYTAAATITMVGMQIGSNVSTAIELAGSTSGQAQVIPTAIAGNTIATLPPVTGTLASTSGTNLNVADIYRGTALSIQNSVTPTLIPGLAGLVAVGTYRLRAVIDCTPAATGGIALSFVLTTAVLSACNFIGQSIVSAAAPVLTKTTTTTSATSLTAVATIPTVVYIDGTFTVSTAGTFSLFGCQNTQVNSAATINLGSTLELVRIA